MLYLHRELPGHQFAASGSQAAGDAHGKAGFNLVFISAPAETRHPPKLCYPETCRAGAPVCTRQRVQNCTRRSSQEPLELQEQRATATGKQQRDPGPVLLLGWWMLGSH